MTSVAPSNFASAVSVIPAGAATVTRLPSSCVDSCERVLPHAGAPNRQLGCRLRDHHLARKGNVGTVARDAIAALVEVEPPRAGKIRRGLRECRHRRKREPHDRGENCQAELPSVHGGLLRLKSTPGVDSDSRTAFDWAQRRNENRSQWTVPRRYPRPRDRVVASHQKTLTSVRSGGTMPRHSASGAFRSAAVTNPASRVCRNDRHLSGERLEFMNVHGARRPRCGGERTWNRDGRSATR